MEWKEGRKEHNDGTGDGNSVGGYGGAVVVVINSCHLLLLLLHKKGNVLLTKYRG